MEKERKQRPLSRILRIGVPILLLLFALAVFTLSALGYELLYREIFGFAYTVVFIVFNFYYILRWTKNIDWVKLRLPVVAFVMLLFLCVLAFTFSYCRFRYFFDAMHYYETLTSPTGEEIIITRELFAGESMWDGYKSYYKAYGLWGDPEQYIKPDMYYYYQAYKHTSDIWIEEKWCTCDYLVINVNSKAQILPEWKDDQTLLLTISNPEERDRGELTLQYK